MANFDPTKADLVTVGQAKAWIPGFVNNPVPDDVIQTIVTATSRDIVRMLGAKVDYDPNSPTFGYSTLNAQINFTLVMDGNGSDVLFPPIRPLINLTSLLVNGYAPPINVGYGQQGVAIETDGYSIAFQSAGFGHGSTTTQGWPVGGSSGRFPMGRRNVQLGCLAGYGTPTPNTNPQEWTAPADLQEACMMIVAYNYTRRDRVGLDSENIANVGSTTYMKLEYPPEAKVILNKYVRVALGSQA